MERLPIYGTELDLDGTLAGVINDDVQVANFKRVFPVFWEHPAVKGITIWGYVRGFHWRNAQGDWLLYPNGGERPALQWLIRYVQDKIPVISPGQSYTVNENVFPGSSIGPIAVSDGDGDALSQWQLVDSSGKFVINADTGVIAQAPGVSLDFEMAKSYTIGVSAYDGYRRSAIENVTINVVNLNDNVPVITAGQSYRIDGGRDNAVARVKATDADDTNQPGFTTFSGWAITAGNTNSVFRFSGTGELQVGRPLLIDWRRSSYVLGTRVGDGTNNSAVQAVEVTIPNRVNLCLANVIRLEAPKATAPLLILLGAELGSCR